MPGKKRAMLYQSKPIWPTRYITWFRSTERGEEQQQQACASERFARNSLLVMGSFIPGTPLVDCGHAAMDIRPGMDMCMDMCMGVLCMPRALPMALYLASMAAAPADAPKPPPALAKLLPTDMGCCMNMGMLPPPPPPPPACMEAVCCMDMDGY